jgi:hypothetical protein
MSPDLVVGNGAFGFGVFLIGPLGLGLIVTLGVPGATFLGIGVRGETFSGLRLVILGALGVLGFLVAITFSYPSSS